ncbi:MAG: (4Fe-4S)-binding protein [Armatimonadetes bacterium]|nr:(4Fe-4S)-binding protein [Armatimonadota bacterium]
MMITAEQVKQRALEAGADLVGIGDMARFEGAPLDFDPRYIFPEARAIIGLGFRIHRGLLRGIEEGTFFAAYPSMGYANINDVHAPIALRAVGNLLEDHGYEAVLYQNTSVRYGANAGRPVRPGYPRPDVFLHFRIAAFICGMGEIGYSKVFLTPQFGPRQRFAFIITDAPLEPDPLYDGPPLCDRCMRCVAECPAGAISATETVKVTIAGREVEWGRLDVDRCTVAYQAGVPEYSPFIPPHVADFVDRLREMPPGPEREQFLSEHGGAWQMGLEVPYNKAGWESYHHPGAICGGRGCIRACMIHLEQQGKLANRFQSPFRIREPWALR